MMECSGVAADYKSALLCLKCRAIGHDVAACVKPDFLTDGDGQEWFQSSLRDRLRLRLQCHLHERNILCERCASLDLPSWLRSMPQVADIEDLSNICESRFKHEDFESKETCETFHDIGTVLELQLRRDCSLCVCLFDLIPNPRSATQVVSIAISWTYFRMEHHTTVDTAARKTSSRFMTAILGSPLPGEEVHRTMTIEGDGVVIDQGDFCSESGTFGSTPVYRDKINFTTLWTWVEICMNKHQLNCSRPGSSRLRDIRLIDARTRTIVPYSEDTREYLTLSYVWGGVDQSFPGSGCVGASLPKTLPQTLQDAITFALQFGKRYLWVDSICIDQSDLEDKEAQIAIMSDIYRNSFATVIALDGRDADAGLYRISIESPVAQMSYNVNGTILRTIGPTLGCLVSEAHWSSRAWTYQEAILSPRCIYVSKYGLHFECNSMHCCESLDAASSPSHNEIKDVQSFNRETYNISLNLGTLRNPVVHPIADLGRALNVYSLLATQYNPRRMTHCGDALSAFSGVLQALQDNVYRTGFIWGLPLVHLNWAMVWQAREAECPRNSNFPSWSWLSNTGGIWPGGPSLGRDGASPDSCPFDLMLAMYDRRSPAKRKTVFKQTWRTLSSGHPEALAQEPLSNALLQESTGDFNIPPGFGESQTARILFFDSFAFRFAIAKRWEVEGNTFHSFLSVQVAHQEIEGITTYDPSPKWKIGSEHLWLLLTRHIEGDHTMHNFILLERRGGCFERADMLRLHIPNQKVWVLAELGLHRLRGVLI